MSRNDSGFHLNKANGKFLGVCAGIADYLGVDVLWVRVALVLLTLLGWGTAIPIYFVIAFVAPRAPTSDTRAIDYDGMDDERYLDRMRRRRDRSNPGTFGLVRHGPAPVRDGAQLWSQFAPFWRDRPPELSRCTIKTGD